jgi:hypothetical protein
MASAQHKRKAQIHGRFRIEIIQLFVIVVLYNKLDPD